MNLAFKKLFKKYFENELFLKEKSIIYKRRIIDKYIFKTYINNKLDIIYFIIIYREKQNKNN